MSDSNYYKWVYRYHQLGSGVLARVQYKEITDDIETCLAHEINFGCSSRLIDDLYDNLVCLLFFEKSYTDVQNQIKNHSDLVEHINTY